MYASSSRFLHLTDFWQKFKSEAKLNRLFLNGILVWRKIQGISLGFFRRRSLEKNTKLGRLPSSDGLGASLQTLHPLRNSKSTQYAINRTMFAGNVKCHKRLKYLIASHTWGNRLLTSCFTLLRWRLDPLITFSKQLNQPTDWNSLSIRWSRTRAHGCPVLTK